MKDAASVGTKQTLLFALLAILFAVALTYASVELPALANRALQSTFGETLFPRLYTGPHEQESQPYIEARHIRPVGYVCLILVIALIAAGLLAERRGLAAAGALALFLPVFGHFAISMFFLAGLGLLRTIWMPLLDGTYALTGDASFWLFRLGDVAYAPYMIAVYLAALVRLDLRFALAYIVMGLGLFVFTFGTLAWFHARLGGSGTADYWIYRFSRHPQYVGWIVWSYGLLLYFLQHSEGNWFKISWGIPDSLPWLIATMVIVGVAWLEEIRMRREHSAKYEAYRLRTPFLVPLPRLVSRACALPIRLILRKEAPETGREVAVVVAMYALILMGLSWAFVALGLPPHRRMDLFPYTVFPFR